MIVAVGGNLDTTANSVILGELKERIPETSRAAIIPTASKIPGVITKQYEDALELIGFETISVIPIAVREDTYKEPFLEIIREANMIVLTGGDQLRLTSIIGGTPVQDLIKKKADKDIVMGISAGATVLSDPMIYNEKKRGGFLKGGVELTSGFELLKNVAIDSHFLRRGRIPRLIYVVVSNPEVLGVGLDENTAIFVENHIATVCGEYSVIIVDGRRIEKTNIATVKEKDPIAATNICIHMLAHGSVIDLEKRSVLELG